MNERDEAIIRLLRVHQYMTVQELCTQVKASPATIRRALTRLNESGHLQYVNGGALLLKPDVGAKPEMMPQKLRIVHAALDLISPHDTLFLDAGSTNNLLADALIAIDHICVVTNSIYIAYKLYTGNPTIDVFVCGGNVGNEGPMAGMVGSLAESLIGSMRAHTFFMGAAAVHEEHGITDPYMNSASLKRSMMEKAQQTVLLCDHTKFGTVCRAYVSPLNRVDQLITDAQASEAVPSALLALGRTVLTV
ncbi:MAG: DeoR/GlpR family DNA-binding transcription regulator [Clostridia bacterium]